MAELFGVDYPTYFIHPAAEYQSLVTHLGVIDLTHWRSFRVVGKDRVSFLNAMVTSDVASLEPGKGSRSLITTIKGKIIAELLVMVREEDVLVIVPQGNADDAYDVLQKHIIMEDVSIDDVSSQYGVIALEGPKAEDVMWRIFSTGPFPKEAFQSFEREFHKTNVFLFQHSITGEDGYHLMIPAEHIESLRDYLVQASRGSDGLPVGSIAWNMRRVEHGLPWYNIDYNGDNFPDETRLGSTVNYTKGCFLGQETLTRLHHRGHVNRLLVGLSVDDDGVPEGIRQLVDEFARERNNFDEVGLKKEAESAARVLNLLLRNGNDSELFPTKGEDREKAIGRVTSVAFSPQLKKPLFLGYVRREIAEQSQPVRTSDKLTLKPIELPIATSGTNR